MQGQAARTADDEIPSLDDIEGILARAFGVSVLDDCLCKLGNHQHRLAPRVRQALSDMGCNPDAVAEKIRTINKELPAFVISESGFGGAPHVALRLIALGALAVLDEGARQLGS